MTIKYDGADMWKDEAIEAMMKAAIAEFGSVDMLVDQCRIQRIAGSRVQVAKWDAVLTMTSAPRPAPARTRCPA